MLNFVLIELKFKTLIGLGTKHEYAKFGIDWFNGSLIIGIRKKCCNPFFTVSAVRLLYRPDRVESGQIASYL